MSHEFPGYDGLELVVLRRYIAGQGDMAERRRVEAWAAEAVERRRYLAAMRQLYERGTADSRDEAAAQWARISVRMESPSDGAAKAATYVAPWEIPAVHVDVRRGAPRVLGGAFAPRRRWQPFVAAAAVLALAVGGRPLVSRLRARAVSAADAVRMRQIVTGKGQRAEFQLSDGSRVVLGADSRVRFLEKFGAESRDLYLDGVAYFDVAHDAARPFLVHTANAVAEDIGTRFVVTAYASHRATQVIVSDGLVAFRDARAPKAVRVVLRQGQLGRLMASEQVPTVRAVNPEAYSAWMHGELVFRDAPLSEVAAELGHWYDGEVRLGDAVLADVPLTAAFAGESFHEAVNVVTTVAPVRAVWRGRTVTLYRR